MSTIPASYSVEVSPSVLAAGGAALALNGVCLTTSNRVPIGIVMSFPDAASVKAYFGASSIEGIIAGGGLTQNGLPAGKGYFGGYETATATPGALLFAQYNQSAVAAYLRGGNISNLTLAQLQSISGSLNVTIDGYPRTAAAVNLSAATSFSSAAAIIATALNAGGTTQSSFTASMGAGFTGTGAGTDLTTTSVVGIISVGDTVTGTGVPANTTIVSQTSGTAGGAGVYVTSQATTASSATLVANSTILNVTALASGAIAVGQLLVGNSVAANTTISAILTETGGIGTYRVSGAKQRLVSGAMTSQGTAVAVTYDSVLGAFSIVSGATGEVSSAAFATGTIAATLGLTSIVGAVLSQGAAAAVPGTFMDALAQSTSNWASFFTAFDPDGGSGQTVKLAFAAWTNTNAPRYVYVEWDTDVTAPSGVPAAASVGYQVNNTLDYSGTFPIWEPEDLNHAAFVSGAIAALDFNVPNGRIAFAYKTQSGLQASVTTLAAAVNLGGNPKVIGSYGNGYNFIGAFGTANDGFVNLQRGSISGDYAWLDSYVNQIALTNDLQLAAYVYMTQVNSFPYTSAGYASFATALQSTINKYLAFGAYAPGVALSSSQITAINNRAGAKIADTLQSQGWYLQILPATAEVRASRASPPIIFWYVDDGSVQALNVGAVAVA